MNVSAWMGVVGALGFWTIGAIAPAEERTLTNLEGKEIKAELISATETTVLIKLANGREYTLALDKLVDADQEYLRKWRSEHPEDVGAITGLDGASAASEPQTTADEGGANVAKDAPISKLELDYRFVKKKTGTKKLGKGQVIETWLYDVELSNKSREAIPPVTIKYEMFIYYDSKYSDKKRGLARTVEGAYPLKGLPGQGRVSFNTDGIPVQTDKSRTLNGDIVTVVQYEEDLEGIILTFYQGETKVGTQAYGRTKRD